MPVHTLKGRVPIPTETDRLTCFRGSVEEALRYLPCLPLGWPHYVFVRQYTEPNDAGEAVLTGEVAVTEITFQLEQVPPAPRLSFIKALAVAVLTAAAFLAGRLL